jgi:hypothetical protein
VERAARPSRPAAFMIAASLGRHREGFQIRETFAERADSRSKPRFSSDP